MTKLPWYLRLGSTTHLLARWRAADVLDLAERVRMPIARRRRRPDRAAAARPALRRARPLVGPPDRGRRRPVAARAGRGGPPAVRRRLLDPLLVDRVGRRRHRHRLRRRRRRGAAHRRAARAARSRWRSATTPVSGARRRGRRGAPAVRRGDGRLLARPRGDGRGAARRRLAAHRRPRRDRRDAAAWCWPAAPSEMYIRGGYNVHPVEVEAVLGQHPAVAAGRGRPPARRVMGEVGVAVGRARRPGGAARAGRPARVRARPAGAAQAARGRGGARRRAPAHRRCRRSTARPSPQLVRRSGQRPEPGHVARGGCPGRPSPRGRRGSGRGSSAPRRGRRTLRSVPSSRSVTAACQRTSGWPAGSPHTSKALSSEALAPVPRGVDAQPQRRGARTSRARSRARR